MESGESKKLALLYILDILKRETNAEHPLHQEEIGDLLEQRYFIRLERKAIARNLSLLLGAGYDVVSTPQGTYLGDREFEPSELRLLIDSVLFSRHISSKHSRDLAERIAELGGRYFESHRHHANIDLARERNKNEFSQLFYAVEVVDDAIEAGRKISFTYSKYGADKRLHKSSDHVVSPYQMILQNQHYYLMAYSDTYARMTFFRMDKISGVKLEPTAAVPIRSLAGYESGINYRYITSGLPYMYGDPPVLVTFACDASIIDQVVDWFGFDSVIRKTADPGTLEVSVQVSPLAMECWALQYARYVRILTPTALRNRVREALQNALTAYQGDEN